MSFIRRKILRLEKFKGATDYKFDYDTKSGPKFTYPLVGEKYKRFIEQSQSKASHGAAPQGTKRKAYIDRSRGAGVV